MAALKEHGRNREAVGMCAQDAAARVVACSHPASKFEDRQETAVGKQEAVGRLLSEGGLSIRGQTKEARRFIWRQGKESRLLPDRLLPRARTEPRETAREGLPRMSPAAGKCAGLSIPAIRDRTKAEEAEGHRTAMQPGFTFAFDAGKATTPCRHRKFALCPAHRRAKIQLADRARVRGG